MIVLAERAENYLKQSQREQQENPNSISHENYDAQESRAKAFQ